MCMKQHPEWGLHEDNADSQNLCFANMQLKPPQHCRHLIGAPHHAREASQNLLNANMSPMSQPYCKHPPERHRQGCPKIRSGRGNQREDQPNYSKTAESGATKTLAKARGPTLSVKACKEWMVVDCKSAPQTLFQISQQDVKFGDQLLLSP